MPVLYRRAQGACTSILDEFTAARNPELTTPVGPPLTRSSAFYLVWDTRHLSVLPRKVGVALSTLPSAPDGLSWSRSQTSRLLERNRGPSRFLPRRLAPVAPCGKRPCLMCRLALPC